MPFNNIPLDLLTGFGIGAFFWFWATAVTTAILTRLEPFAWRGAAHA